MDGSSSSSVELEWRQIIPTGAGLENMGNTCFMNSVLQCLTYTPPLASYMLSGEHSRTCPESGFCMICTMKKHIIQVFKNSGSVIQPRAVLSLPHWIGQQFEIAAQQDAHEFFAHTLQAMHQSYLSGCILNGQRVETSLVHQIFEGRLRTTIKCGCCGAVCHAFQSYRDIAVGVEGAYNIPQALRWHLKFERLGGYSCRRCKKTGQASKKTTFHNMSKVLVINLKRFDHHQGKIVKHVRYPEHLDMRPFMSQSCGQPEFYRLYGVLVHSGNSCDSGHYYCHVKASDGQWYKMDDASVSLSDRRSALTQEAYLLFYIRASNSTQLRNTAGQSSSNMPTQPHLTPNTVKKAELPHSTLPPVKHQSGCIARSQHRAPRNDTDKTGPSSSRTVSHLTREQSDQSPLKRKRQRGDNYQNGESHHPQRMRKDITGGSEAKQSTGQPRKRRLEDERDEGQKELSSKRKLKLTDRSHQNYSSKVHITGPRNNKKRADLNHRTGCGSNEVPHGQKRAHFETGIGGNKDNVTSSSSRIRGEQSGGFSKKRNHENSSTSPVKEQRSRKRQRHTDVQQSSCGPKRARTHQRVLISKGDYVKRCSTAVIQDLSDCFSLLRVA